MFKNRNLTQIFRNKDNKNNNITDKEKLFEDNNNNIFISYKDLINGSYKNKNYYMETDIINSADSAGSGTENIDYIKNLMNKIQLDKEENDDNKYDKIFRNDMLTAKKSIDDLKKKLLKKNSKNKRSKSKKLYNTVKSSQYKKRSKKPSKKRSKFKH